VSVTRDELLQVIAENPADENAWLLYADWLQQRSEPRGELIALDIALEQASGERKTELEAARVELLASYGAALLGETFAKFVASGYAEVVWHRGFITVFGYVGNTRVTHLRAVGWLVKLILDNPEPFTFLKKLTLSHTDIADVVPFAQFKHLVEIDVRSTNVKAASVEKLQALRPSMRVRSHSHPGT
jgi:uncharacterized protein (TIGR02996 family)